MLRLVLAVREADGEEAIPEETLDDLPRFRNAVAGVLRHAGLADTGILRPRRHPRPVGILGPGAENPTDIGPGDQWNRGWR